MALRSGAAPPGVEVTLDPLVAADAKAPWTPRLRAPMTGDARGVVAQFHEDAALTMTLTHRAPQDVAITSDRGGRWTERVAAVDGEDAVAWELEYRERAVHKRANEREERLEIAVVGRTLRVTTDGVEATDGQDAPEAEATAYARRDAPRPGTAWLARALAGRAALAPGDVLTLADDLAADLVHPMVEGATAADATARFAGLGRAGGTPAAIFDVSLELDAVRQPGQHLLASLEGRAAFDVETGHVLAVALEGPARYTGERVMGAATMGTSGAGRVAMSLDKTGRAT